MAVFSTSVAWAEPGALRQLPPPSDCFSDGWDHRCTQGRPLFESYDAALSKDGRNLYVPSYGDGGVAVFSRDTETGSLEQLAGPDGCLFERDLPASTCRRGRALSQAGSIAVPKDGRHVYVGSNVGVDIFKWDRRSGLLEELEGTAVCLRPDGKKGCSELPTLRSGVVGLEISGDGKHVYASGSPGISMFRRNRRSGVLTAQQSIPAPWGSFALSPEDRNLYMVSRRGIVSVFALDPETGALTQLPGKAGCVARPARSSGCTKGIVSRAIAVAVSPDGRHVYVTGFGGSLAAFERDAESGALRGVRGPGGCFHRRGARGCTEMKPLAAAQGLAVSEDGRYVYVATTGRGAVFVFARDADTGALAPLPGSEGCVAENGRFGCTPAVGFGASTNVILSPDGANAYVTSVVGLAAFSREKE